MNAKFEKWYADLVLDKRSKAYNNPLGMPSNGDMHRAMEMGWQAGERAAIQSLEVTPELRSLAEEAFRSSDGESWSGWLNDALNAFLSALKEQAK